VSHRDRLSGLDASFLALEDGGAHMHVGSVLLLEGEAPAYPDFVAQVEHRLALVPRYRQKLAFPPLVQSRPVWVDDPHFNAGYHLRHTALPAPAGEHELRQLAGRIFAQRLDRSKPLWELWLVDRVGDDRFAIIARRTTASSTACRASTCDGPVRPRPRALRRRRRRAVGAAAPSPAGGAARRRLVERAAGRSSSRARRPAPSRARRTRWRRAARVSAGSPRSRRPGVGGARALPLNVEDRPHRRFAWVDGDLATFKAIKNALGGHGQRRRAHRRAGAAAEPLPRHGYDTDVELKAMVPVSVRAESERGALGNKVAAMYAPLPIGLPDPIARFLAVHDAMRGLKDSGQAVGAEMIAALADFAPPTILSQAARIQAVQRFFNLTVTNVPGPQFPLYLLGRPLARVYPLVPIVENAALGIAIMSYNGRIDFGLVADYDALPDLDDIAAALEASIEELAAVAGDTRTPLARRSRAELRA
jgi:WS/DGAT/MGAT family acyltransferase